MDTLVTTEGTGGVDRSSRVHVGAGGRRIGYAEYGDPNGRPVMALHGTPGSRYMFALTDEPARARNMRIIAPERPGYGLSHVHRFETLAETVGDVETLADALGLERFALLGVSGGGPHAVAVASVLKQRVLRMALVAPVGPIADCGDHIRMSHLHQLIFTRLAPSYYAAGAFFASLRTMIDWAPSLAYQILMQRVTAFDREILHRPEVRDNLRAALSEGLRNSIEGALQDLRLYCGPWRLPLADVEVPTIMWQGSADTIVPPDAAYYLAGALPSCQLEIIEGPGHYWVFGALDHVLDEVNAAWSRP